MRAQHNMKTRRATIQTYDLNDFFGDDWKEIRKQISRRTVYICENIVLSKYWISLVYISNSEEFP